MTQPPAGPGAGDWLAALGRAFRPARWLLCLAGLALCWGTVALAQPTLGPDDPGWSDWWSRPGEVVRSLGEEVAGWPLDGVVLCFGPLLAVAAALWCLVGGWVARDELLARSAREGLRPGPTAFVAGLTQPLLLCCLIPLMFALLALVPLVVAGWVNVTLGGLGALLLSLLLPALLVMGLILLVVSLGVLSWPLMPAALAAERSDAFDAVSRAYNYALQRPARFLLLTGAAVGLAGLPPAALHYLFPEPVADLPPLTQRAVAWLAAALSASIFWSLVPLVYLDLRAAIDEVNADEVAADPPLPEKPQPSPPPQRLSDGPSRGVAGRLARTVPALALLAGAWWLTAWVLGRMGGETAWLTWGLGDPSVPPVTGLYRLASWVAALVGVACFGLPVVGAVRRRGANGG